jgi:hypothetical protein
MDSNKENAKAWNKLYYQDKKDKIQFAQGVAEATLLYGCKTMEVYTKEELQELCDIYNMVFVYQPPGRKPPPGIPPPIPPIEPLTEVEAVASTLCEPLPMVRPMVRP